MIMCVWYLFLPRAPKHCGKAKGTVCSWRRVGKVIAEGSANLCPSAVMPKIVGELDWGLQ